MKPKIKKTESPERQPQDINELSDQYSGYEDNYSPFNFSNKIKAISHLIGEKATSKMLLLYHMCADPDSPLTKVQKRSLIGVLGYVICPIDLISDFIPVVGLTDDVSAVAIALGIIINAISDKTKIKVLEERVHADIEQLFD